MHTAGIIYRSFILPVLDYCDTVWNCCGRTNADNRIITETCGKDYHANQQQ